MPGPHAQTQADHEAVYRLAELCSAGVGFDQERLSGHSDAAGDDKQEEEQEEQQQEQKK